MTHHSPPNTLVYNFAATGATIDASIVPAEVPEIPSFVNQTLTFASNAGSALSSVNWRSSQSLFLIWFGTNDLSTIATSGVSRDRAKMLIRELVERYYDLMGDLYRAGARRFMVLTVPREYSGNGQSRLGNDLTGVPAVDRTPSIVGLGLGLGPYIQSNLAQFNSLLQSSATDFISKHAGSSVTVLDTGPIYANILDNPQQHGAPNNTCFSNDGYSCLWWNNFHPGIAIHEAIGDAAFEKVDGAESGFYGKTQGMSAKGLMFASLRGLSGGLQV